MRQRKRQSRAATVALTPVLATWLGLGASIGFYVWILGIGRAGPGTPEVALGSYGRSLLPGLAASAALVGLGFALGQAAWLARASYASCLLYCACLATLGPPPLRWAALAAACALLAALRRSALTNASSALLLLHAMGSLSGLYLTFQLRTFLAAWPAFREVLGALWLL
jgi:hypothetical protein